MTTPYFRPGVTRVFSVPTLTVAAPTAAQVNAGMELTTANDLADIQGFSYSNQPVEVGDYHDNFVGKVVGLDQSADGTLIFWEKKGTAPANPLRTSLIKGTVTNIVIFFAGTAGASPAAGDLCDVFPCVSSGPAKEYSRTEAAKWHVAMPASSRPTQDVALV